MTASALAAKIDVVIPGLCGPLPGDAGVADAPVVGRLNAALGHTRSRAQTGYFDQLAHCLSMQVLPAAALSLLASTDRYDAHHCLRVEPVHLKADMDHAILLDQSMLALTHAEKTSLLAELDAHFAETGVQIIADEAGDWYIVSDRSFEIDTFPVYDVIARNVKHFLPTGEGAVNWRRFLNESQMLLHMSPVNEAREQDGRMTANSLWLWGESRLPQAEDPGYDLVVGDGVLHRGIARFFGIEYVERGALPFTELAARTSLVCDSRLLGASAYGDVESWLQLLELTLAEVVEPLRGFARAHGIACSVMPCNGVQYHVDRRRLRDLLPWPTAPQVVCYDDPRA